MWIPALLIMVSGIGKLSGAAQVREGLLIALWVSAFVRSIFR